MSKTGIGALIGEEAARRGVDIVDLAAKVLSAADMVRDETIDPERRELALEAGCAVGDLIVDIGRQALKRRRAQERRTALAEAA